jgi:hypothetical protein
MGEVSVLVAADKLFMKPMRDKSELSEGELSFYKLMLSAPDFPDFPD